MPVKKNPSTGLIMDIFGPTVEVLVSPDEGVCVLKGTLPPGGVVPLHRHADVEGFTVISGEIQASFPEDGNEAWVVGRPGDYIHIPSGVRHAWRNVLAKPAVVIIFTTPTLGRFFEEAARPASRIGQPPMPAELAHFAAISDQYGYWNGTPEENAAIGIHLGP